MTKIVNYRVMAELALKKAGLKLTKPRLMLVDFLMLNNQAMTPYEMRDALSKAGVKADVVTIYRVLEDLEKIKLVHKVMALGRFIRCDNDESDVHCDKDRDCHHYLICQNCRQVEEIAGENLHSLEKKIEHEKEFKIFTHSLEFLGLCKGCQKKG